MSRPKSVSIRNKKIESLVSIEEKEYLIEAAEEEHMSLGGFIRKAAIKAARETFLAAIEGEKRDG